MAHFIQASASEFMSLFQQEQVIALNSSAQALDELHSDLLRTYFLGTQQQAKQLIDSWHKEANVAHYTPGNMSAGNLPLLFNHHPLQREHEAEGDFREHYRHKEFAYVNDDNQLCGLIVMARDDDPSQWMIGVITNTNLPPQKQAEAPQAEAPQAEAPQAEAPQAEAPQAEAPQAEAPQAEVPQAEVPQAEVPQAEVPPVRTITLLTSVDLNRFITNTAPQPPAVEVINVDCADSPLSAALKSPFIAEWITLLTQQQGELNNKWQRLSYLLRTINSNERDVRLNAEPIDLGHLKPEDLIADNPIVDCIDQFRIEPSAAAFQAICDKESTLYQALLRLNVSEDNAVKEHLLGMALVFHEHDVLSSASAFLDEHVFSKVGVDSFWHETQIQLIPHLILEEYPAELFQLILSEPAYYEGIFILTKWALSESDDPRALMANVRSLFDQPDKLNELHFIATIADRHCRALCLIFWAKEESSDEKYQNIISQCNNYPYLAESLCARSKQGKSPADLYKELFNPAKHLRHSLMHHFAQQFTRYHLDAARVKQLSPAQLTNAHKAFKVIEHAHLRDEKKYQLILDNGNDGLLWRLFLPELANAPLKTERQQLIHFLYVGIINGTQSQGKIIVDESLAAQASELRQRFICVKQMLDLQVPGDVTRFTANKDNVRSKKLRSIILTVEEQCKDVHECISQSRDKYAAWQKIETKYRQSLYTIAYEALINPRINVAAKIDIAQQEVLAVVDTVTTEWWSKILIAIANTLIFLLSCSIANIINQRQTGTFWFFMPTQPSELIRGLQKNIVDIIDAPEPHPVPS